jgi:hypothetical protein
LYDKDGVLLEADSKSEVLGDEAALFCLTPSVSCTASCAIEENILSVHIFFSTLLP